MPAILGLDIGGANLKAAHSDGSARTVPFALWKAPDQLAAQLRQLLVSLPPHDRLAVTMTGELCDCFVNRREGVRSILRSVAEVAGEMPVRVWTTQGDFVGLGRAHEEPMTVASANWLALAYLAGKLDGTSTSLLLDIGTTTTDLVYLRYGCPEPLGLTDRARLTSGELVYTGVHRTPICAVLGGEVAAELFATMLDAYLVLGLLPEDANDTETADGRPATIPYARMRLARMKCGDAEDFAPEKLERLGRKAVDRQVALIAAALERVLRDRSGVQTIVLSGSGEVLGRLVCRDFSGTILSLREQLGAQRSKAACAYAVAVLAADLKYRAE